MVCPGTSSVDLVKAKLSQPATASKKALYAASAATLIVVTVIAAFLLVLYRPETAHDAVTLATTAIMGFMALAVTLITGQSAFDWRAVSSLESMSSQETVQTSQPVNELDLSNVRSPKDFLGDSPL
jgi:hypothetical protein